MTPGRSRIGVFGAGYVGLVTAAGIAELGREVVLHDVDANKIARLQRGELPIYEAGLAEIVARNVAAARLRFSADPAAAVAGCALVFIAVGTPPAAGGGADLHGVRSAARTIAAHLDGPTVIVNKSTVPVETADLVATIVRDAGVAHPFSVVSNPEFLREGSAVHDFFHPDRIVIGSDDARAVAPVRELYAPLDAPVLVTDARSAELIKYAANAFLALKISFANTIASVCSGAGADATAVLHGVGADRRIGPGHLQPGLGFGGSCLPKDVAALQAMSRGMGVTTELLDAIVAVNRGQIERVLTVVGERLGSVRGSCVGVLGLAFKAGTDDVRESPAIALAEALLDAGATVAVHDPVASANARARLGTRVTYAAADAPYEAARGADALVLATEWPQYRDLDGARLRALMRRPLLIDARNVYDDAAVARLGIPYAGLGRKPCAS